LAAGHRRRKQEDECEEKFEVHLTTIVGGM